MNYVEIASEFNNNNFKKIKWVKIWINTCIPIRIDVTKDHFQWN